MCGNPDRIVFTSKPLLTPAGKDPISNLNISMVQILLLYWIKNKTSKEKYKRACPKECSIFLLFKWEGWFWLKDDDVFDLITLEPIFIMLRKPVLCKQNYFDYSVSLFSLYFKCYFHYIDVQFYCRFIIK